MTINGIELIVDRTISDVEIAKSLIRKGLSNMTNDEKQAFLSGLKGAYNYIDVNRVESVVEYLAERLVRLPEEIKQYANSERVYWYDDYFNVDYNPQDYEGIKANNNWTINDIFSKSEREEYLQKILYIIASIGEAPKDFPSTLENLTHSGANNIEKSLIDFEESLKKLKKDKETLILGTKKSWYYSGDLYGGEV